jgi:micrococcal nuclease
MTPEIPPEDTRRRLPFARRYPIAAGIAFGLNRLAASATAFWAACCLGQPLPQAGAPDAAPTGVVTRVSDGDTLWVRPDAPNADGRRPKPIKLRLQGIDAPERCQAWGPQAQAALAARVLHRQVELQTAHARDDYGRTLGNVLLQGEDISAWMVSQGHAWSYRYRRSDGPYAAQEQAARRSKHGLFADPQAVAPREFRRLHGPCMD